MKPVSQLSVSEILAQFENSGLIMYHATLEGDYKRNNAEGKRLTDIFKRFEKDEQLADKCIKEMLKSNNVVVRSKAAAYCLALNRNLDIAQAILTEISNDKGYGIFRFNAEMTLKVWREEGTLVIYQKKKSKVKPTDE